MNANELYHHGVKGQKWHVRRFQNKDGSLTAEGKKRKKQITAEGKKRKKQLTADKLFEQNIKNGKDKSPISSAEKITKDTTSIIKNTSNILNSISKIRSLKKSNNQNPVVKQTKPVSEMSDDEIRRVVNRITLEKTYKSLTQSPSTVNRGMERTLQILEIAGGVAGIAGSISGIASTINTLMR